MSDLLGINVLSESMLEWMDPLVRDQLEQGSHSLLQVRPADLLVVNEETLMNKSSRVCLIGPFPPPAWSVEKHANL